MGLLTFFAIALVSPSVVDGGPPTTATPAAKTAAPTFLAPIPGDVKAPTLALREAVQKEVGRLLPSLNDCIRDAPSGWHGGIDILMHLASDGRATGLVFERDGPIDPEYHSCILRTLGGLRVAEQREAADVTVSLWLRERVYGSLDKSIIRRVVTANGAQVRYCYERRLTPENELAGKVLMRWFIRSDGTVGHPVVLHSEIKDAELESCLISVISKWRFPKPKGGGLVVVRYPFLFRRANDDGDP